MIACISINMHTYIQTCIHTYVHAYIYTRKECVFSYLHINIYRYIDIYIYRERERGWGLPILLAPEQSKAKEKKINTAIKDR